jgi:hypothetical protein
MISDNHRELEENWALLCNYVARSGNSIPTFQDNLSVVTKYR